jgi:hypothetical protein
VVAFSAAGYWFHVSSTAVRVGARVMANENFSVFFIGGVVFGLPGVCLLVGGVRGSRPAAHRQGT